jgi:quercetin dioxygenase-like cupin family protein
LEEEAVRGAQAGVPGGAQAATGQRGPEHRVDREQIWTVLEGQLRVQVAGRTLVAQAGDTLCVPPGLPRQVTAAADTRAIVASPVGPTVTTAGGGSRPLPWAA